TALGKLLEQGLRELGKVAVQRLEIAALQDQLGTVAEHQRAETVPLRLVDPPLALGQVGSDLRQHRRDRALQHGPSIPTRLDAGLLAHPGYPALPERADLIARIASVVTISAPFHGTPLAGRIAGSAWFAAPALWFGSILASRGRLRLAGQVATLFNLVKRAGRQEPTPTDELIAQLADVDDETAKQIRRFLADVARDHELVRDLTPESMGELNRALLGGDVISPVSFVSVAPRPGFSPWTFAFAPLQRLLYDVTYRLTAGRPPEGARAPEGSWIGRHRAALTSTANDGIVPAWSQTLDGRAE